MKIIDKYEHIGLKTALEIFVPIFVMEHDWCEYDNYDRVVASKKEYVEKKGSAKKSHIFFADPLSPALLNVKIRVSVNANMLPTQLA